MTFAFLIEDYNHFYSNYLESHKELKEKSFNEKISELISKKYYQSDSLASELTKMGHNSHILVPECNPLQLTWAKENNKALYWKWKMGQPYRSIQSRIFKQFHTFDSIREEILIEQLKKIKPDVVYIFSGIWLGREALEKIKKLCKKVILQWSCPVVERWNNFPFDEFDFILSSSIPLVKDFENKKLKTFYLQQSFDEEILKAVPQNIAPTKDVIFIGNFNPHPYRAEVLEFLLKNNVKIDVYGTVGESISKNSLLRKTIKPPLHGIEMFSKYKEYKIALHIHGQGTNNNDGIDWSSFAGAKRNFEITGIGTALLSSYQENLKELFEPDKEILIFKTKEDCLEKIKSYLKQPELLKQIAYNGQRRVLREHTFKNRAETLMQLIAEN